MATTYKRLGAIASTGTIGTADTLYTVPSATSTVISSIVVCNTAATAATFRIAVSATSSFVAAGYLYYGLTVAANDSATFTLGITLDAAKNLLCSASASTVSFSAFGSEIS